MQNTHTEYTARHHALHSKERRRKGQSSAEDELRKELVAAARRLGTAAQYRSAGTVEFLVDQDTAKFYFLEVNTRLQVRESSHALPPKGLSRSGTASLEIVLTHQET